MAGSAEEPIKGKWWLDAEVEFMLRLLHEMGAGKRVMTSTHMETLSVFERVVRAMAKEGYSRYAGQARAKFKREKNDFFYLIEKYRGNPPREERPPRYKLLKRLWLQAGKPHWKHRHPGTSSRPPLKRRAPPRLDVTSSSSEEEEGEGGGEGEDSGSQQEEAELVGVETGTTTGQGMGPQAKESGPSEDVEDEGPSTYEAWRTPTVNAPPPSQNAPGPQWAELLDQRVSALELRMTAAEQTNRVLSERNNLLKLEVEKQAELLNLQTRGLLHWKKVVEQNRAALGRAPEKEDGCEGASGGDYPGHSQPQ